MNRGLLYKTLHETWLPVVLFALGMGVFETLLTYVLNFFYEDLVHNLLQVSFIQNIFKGLMGTDIGPTVGRGALVGVAWVHPVMLVLMWGHEVFFCTRMPVGEVDRGTIDVLFGLPASRLQLYFCESVVWLVSGVLLVAMALLGSKCGSWLAGEHAAVPHQALLRVAANLFCLYVAVGGLAYVASAAGDRRGQAVAVLFGILLMSLLLNFLAQFWEVAASISFLSLMKYYEPAAVLQDSAWPVRDMAILAAAGIMLWIAGAVIFVRRDICTV